MASKTDLELFVEACIHECAPDHSTMLVDVGFLRRSAKQMATLDAALDEFLAGQHTWGAYRKAERARAMARGENREWQKV